MSPSVLSDPPPAVPARTLSFLPQFDVPFRLDVQGQPVVVQQDSPEEIGAAVFNVCACPQGAKLADPLFGIPSPLFHAAPTNLSGIVAAIRRLEPRANVSGSSQLSDVQQIVNATVGGVFPESGQVPGAGLVPHDSSTVQITTGGPLTTSIDLSVQTGAG